MLALPLIARLAAVACLAAACAGAGGTRSDTPAAVELAPGVFALPGASGDVGPSNRGRTGNAGFIVGESGVIVVDTGTSYRHGRALLAAIGRVTDRPVRQAYVTHARQEFLFGAPAFRERGAVVAMHRQAARLMASRCESCLKTLQRVLGHDEMQGTVMFSADEEFDAAFDTQSIGRPVRVLHYGHSSGPGDVALFDARSGVLFAGGLLDWRRIPDVQDSDLAGWRAALAALRALPVRTIVPGHGPVTGRAAIDAVQRYLDQLEGRVRTLFEAGTALSAVPDAADLPQFSDWDGYDSIHRRNASVLFLRLERARLQEPQ
jgi:glyoxylase-like metal-dependent hydrolase (beta-lactamase superfamily II)